MRNMIAFDFLKSIRAQHSRMLYCGLYILLSGILVVALSVQPNFDVFFLTLSIGLNLFWLALSIGLVAIVSRTIHSVRQRPTKRAAITRLVAFLLILMI